MRDVVTIAPLSAEPSVHDATLALIASELGDGYVTLENIRAYAAHDEDRGGAIAFVDGEVIGVALGGPATRRTSAAARALGVTPSEPAAEVQTVVVERGRRHRGVAGALLVPVLSELAASGFASVLAVVWLSGQDESTDLFRSAGFKHLGDSPRHWWQDSIDRGYDCPSCGNPCQCTAAIWALDEPADDLDDGAPR